MINMSPFNVFRTYLAVRSHFKKKSYDIFKYRGKVTASRETFEARSDRHRMEKLSKSMKDADIVKYMVANFVNNPSFSMFDTQADKCFNKWSGYESAMTRNFETEVRALYHYAKQEGIAYDAIFNVEYGNPLVFDEYMARNLSIQTFVILDRLNKIVDRLENNVVNESVTFTVTKYSPFLQVDLGIYISIEQRVRSQCGY